MAVALAEPRTFFRAMTLLQVVALVSAALALPPVPLPHIVITLLGVVATLAPVLLAAGWAAASQRRDALMAAVLLVVVAIMPGWPFVPSVVVLLVRAVGLVLLAWSLRTHRRDAPVPTAAPIAMAGVVLGVVTVLAELPYELGPLAELVLSGALAALALGADPPPGHDELDERAWRLSVVGARRAAAGEALRLGTYVGVIALALFVFVAFAIPYLALMLAVANLLAIMLTTIGALELREARGATAMWASAGAALGAIAALQAVGEVVLFLDGNVLPEWVQLMRGIGQNGMAICLALGIGALLARDAHDYRPRDAQRCAVTYTSVLMLTVMQTWLQHGVLWSAALAVGVAIVVVMAIAASGLRRLSAEVPLAAALVGSTRGVGG